MAGYSSGSTLARYYLLFFFKILLVNMYYQLKTNGRYLSFTMSLSLGLFLSVEGGWNQGAPAEEHGVGAWSCDVWTESTDHGDF